MSEAYRLAETAERDLSELLLHIAERDGRDRALHVHSKFVDAFEHLASMPATGRTRREIGGDRVRWWRVFRWLVIYDPEASPVTILRVIHGARELERQLGLET